MKKNQKRVGVKPSAKVLKKYCAQRFGAWRSGGIKCTNVQPRTKVNEKYQCSI